VSGKGGVLLSFWGFVHCAYQTTVNHTGQSDSVFKEYGTIRTRCIGQSIQQLLSRGVIHEGTESTCYPHDDDNPRRNRVYLLPTRRRRHSRKRSLIRIGQPDLYSVTGGVFLLSFRGSFLSPSNTRNFPNRSIRILGKVDSPVGIMFYAMMI
jgi:hypothetical protein